MAVLTIKDLHVSVEGKEILKGVNLEVKGGEIHAIMGPNGTGKSTLSSAIMGHPKYEVTQGSITLEISLMKFIRKLDEKMAFLEMNPDMAHRYLNEGFSGGEKKRNEILQLMMLEPKIAILDEIDSGLDIDALKIVAKGINEMRSSEFGCLIITHYQRLLNYITPDYVHVMMQGRIVKSGGPELAQRLEAEGYDWIKKELGIEDETVEQEA
jgi:Fe-S cluster assembly ATP-binding protein